MFLYEGSLLSLEIVVKSAQADCFWDPIFSGRTQLLWQFVKRDLSLLVKFG